MLTSLDYFLTPKGIIDKLQKDFDDVSKLQPVERQKIAALKKINQIKSRLIDIYFSTIPDESKIKDKVNDYFYLRSYAENAQLRLIIQSVINTSDDFDMLKFEQLLASLNASKPGKAIVSDKIKTEFGALNAQYGYFHNPDRYIALYENIASACQIIIEEVEQSGYGKQYQYAYKLMALLIDENEPLPSFETMSTRVNNLLNLRGRVIPKQRPNRHLVVIDKPFHDVFLDLNLPKASEISDRQGWCRLIRLEGRVVLADFSMVKTLEDANQGLAPMTLKEAQKIRSKCQYKRAMEDEDFAKLCFDYQVDEKTFDASLDFLAQNPLCIKTNDSIPHLEIMGEPGTETQGYVWVKLPYDDKRALILGKITDCCQSIGGDSEMCVKNALRLDDSGLYVLLKQKTKKDAPVRLSQGALNYDQYQIVGQSFVWRSKTGSLCLDSLECLKDSISRDGLKKIMLEFSQNVFASNPSIKMITIGRGGNTPQDLFEPTPIPERMREGEQYGDSTQQYCIAKAPIPESKRSQYTALMNILKEYNQDVQEAGAYLAQIFDDLQPLLFWIQQNPQFLNNNININRIGSYVSSVEKPEMSDFEPVDTAALSRLDEKHLRAEVCNVPQ